MPEKETSETIDYFWALWKRKSFIALFTISATAAAAVYGSMLPKEYTVRATALVAPPAHIKYNKTATGGLIDPTQRKQMVQMNPILLTTYHELTKSPVFAQKIVAHLNLKNENGDILEPRSVMQQISSKIVRRNAKVTDYSGLMAIDVRGRNPERITKIANSWTTILAEQSRDIRTHEATTIYKQNLEHAKSIQQRLNAVNDKLEALRADGHLARTHQLVKIKRSVLYVSQLKHQHISSKLEVNKLGLPNINGSNSSKQKSTNKLSDFTRDDVQKILEQYMAFQLGINSKINIDPSSDISAALAGVGTVESPSDFKISGHETRGVLIQASTHVSPDEVTPEVEQLYRKNIKLLTTELKGLERIYQEKMMALDRLSFKRSTLRKQAALVDLKTEEARMLVSEKTSDVRFASTAIKPSSPVWPNIPKIILFSALGSFFVSAVLCLFKGFIDYVEQTKEAIAPPK